MPDEQPNVQTDETTLLGGDGVADILNEGLKEKNATPNQDDVQPSEGEPGNQPTPEEKAEELFGELLLEDEKKLPFKSKKDLEDFIDKNKEIFDKTGHFLRQSDYTRKTQELKTEREQFESERQKGEEIWGEVKPNEDSMKAFGSLWGVFQHGSPELKQNINAFMQDVNLLAQGQQPKGPLSQGADTGPSVEPEIIRLRKELADVRHELTTGRKLSDQERQTQREKQAKNDWDSWASTQEQKGIKVSDELENAMVPYLVAMQNTEMDNSSKLDRAFKLASGDLGLDGNLAVKKVISDVERAKKTSPSAPASKTHAGQEPEAKDVMGILNQGLKKLSA